MSTESRNQPGKSVATAHDVAAGIIVMAVIILLLFVVVWLLSTVK